MPFRKNDQEDIGSLKREIDSLEEDVSKLKSELKKKEKTRTSFKEHWAVFKKKINIARVIKIAVIVISIAGLSAAVNACRNEYIRAGKNNKEIYKKVDKAATNWINKEYGVNSKYFYICRWSYEMPFPSLNHHYDAEVNCNIITDNDVSMRIWCSAKKEKCFKGHRIFDYRDERSFESKFRG